MEQQVLQLLQTTVRPDTYAIREAEQGLLRLHPEPEFPFALLTIAGHADIEPGPRKAALVALKGYVSATWSPQLDETFAGQVYLNDEAKARVREQVFNICTGQSNQTLKEVTYQALAAAVACKIATVDFPDAWPSLFPSLLNILNTSTHDEPIHGALRVLAELVDEGLTEEQFFIVAQDLVNGLQHVAVDNSRGLIVRAMTLNVFRACFEMLEMVMVDHGTAVKQFLNESLKSWMPFFMETLKQPLPQSAKTDGYDADLRGMVAMKVQVVKSLDKLRSVYVQAISPHATELFEIIWQELARLAAPYADLFVEGSAEGKLVDSDNLPCSPDALILEELDFLQVTIKAPPVRKELTAQMQQMGDSQHTVPWLQELIRVLVLYARIPKEEEALWEYDANLYLCEATSLTANYTPRAACAELAVRSLGEWLKQLPIVAMLHFNQHNLQATSTWKEREALLFLLNQSLKDVDEISGKLDPQIASAVLEQVSVSLQAENVFLRAAAQMVLGCFFKISGESSPEYSSAGAAAFTNAITAAANDPSDVVQVACFSILPDYIEALPRNVTQPMQSALVNCINEFASSHDLRDELEDADDVKAAMIQLLRDAIMLDTSTITSPENNAIDLFFTLASDGASNFQLFTLLTEAFESIVSAVSAAGQEPYIRLCAKTIPALTGAFDIANMTQESALTNLAAELVSALAEFGSDPLPAGFVQAVMPKLQRVLMEATEAELVRPATLALNHLLTKGTAQFLEWHDSTGKSSIEVTLTIINRLLNSPDVDENAGQEVGGLASSLVTKFGADKLGPYLMDLLRAVAIRLATAEQIQFIQSLCLVFVGLSLAAPKEVLDFLAEVNINGQNGLNVVLTKWLENSIHFAGFDEVRQNVVALSKIFALHDERVHAVQVKGELIVEPAQSGRIKTRSQAKLNPDRYTFIPADLKILKIMVDELASAATSRFPDLAAAQAAADALDEEDDEADDADEWEDVGNAGALDLAGASVRSDLMSLAKEYGDEIAGGPSPTGSRARDEETAEYLLNWFKAEAGKEGFMVFFEGLSEEEKGRLRSLVG